MDAVYLVCMCTQIVGKISCVHTFAITIMAILVSLQKSTWNPAWTSFYWPMSEYTGNNFETSREYNWTISCSYINVDKPGISTQTILTTPGKEHLFFSCLTEDHVQIPRHHVLMHVPRRVEHWQVKSIWQYLATIVIVCVFLWENWNKNMPSRIRLGGDRFIEGRLGLSSAKHTNAQWCQKCMYCCNSNI